MRPYVEKCLSDLSALWGRAAVVWMVCCVGVSTASEAVSPKGNASFAATNVAQSAPWQRIVMIGASATAGFTASEPLGGTNTAHYALSRYVDAALKVPHDPVVNLGNAFFFFQPEAMGRQQVGRALTNRPTLIIGLDFPFWFLYGEGDTDEARLQRFEQGLKLLEAISCPLVIGDIPDATAAANKMLRPDQIPSLKAIAAGNQRLEAWAAGRGHVAVVKLSDFMRQASANRTISIGGHHLPDGQTRMLLQNDRLHPSPPGCAVLALAVLDACQATRGGGRDEEFIRDP
ncbi:MAG TPA: SGNH/GDSL hydrolase family protein, partial [Verrucomicrobiae bacterium]|nr:SGNH/GDSL hydrolase family protein [Verrucomicrobiae bacterium]